MDLTIHDLNHMAAQCRIGHGRTKRFKSGYEYHLVNTGKRVMVVVYRPAIKRVVNVLPPISVVSGKSGSVASISKAMPARGPKRLPKKRFKSKGY